MLSVGQACGSSDGSRQELADGGEGGQGVAAAGKGGALSPTSGSGGSLVAQAGSGGTAEVPAGAGGQSDGGAPHEGGSTSLAGASPEAGASSEAGAGGDSACGGCCTVDDCPGDGYLCTNHQCTNVAGSLSGLLWKLPCTGPHVDISCTSDPTVTVMTTLGGAAGVTYDVTLHFRGVVERKNYVGGCSDGNFWQTDGVDNGDIGNVYELRVSQPPQHFFLNVGSGPQNNTVALDYVKTIRIDAGATVTLFAASKDSAELFNRDAGSTPISIPSTSVEQPFDGQFIQMDVESVTPSAVASGTVVGGGTSGSALSFSGAQLAAVPDSATLRPTSVTAEAWFKFQGATGGYNAILGKPEGGATNDSYTLWFEAGTLRSYVGAAPSAYISLPWTDVSAWHHGAITYDASTQHQVMYVDGSPIACTTIGPTIAYDAHPFFIGADSDNGAQSGFWNGAIDEVRVFSTARTADQIWADLHTHQLGPSPGLVGEWTFDEGSGQSAADSSGNAQDAVLGVSNAVEPSDPAWVSGR